MPIYEYECHDCRRRVSLLVRTPSSVSHPRCPGCGGQSLSRLMSRFATVKSEEDRLESLADPGKLGDFDEDDPRSVGRFMKRMGRELGEDLGEDFDAAMDEAVEEAEAPESGGESALEDEA